MAGVRVVTTVVAGPVAGVVTVRVVPVVVSGPLARVVTVRVVPVVIGATSGAVAMTGLSAVTMILVHSRLLACRVGIWADRPVIRASPHVMDAIRGAAHRVRPPAQHRRRRAGVVRGASCYASG